MGLFGDLKMYGRFGLGLRKYLREPITLEDAVAAVERRMAAREGNFLRLIERGIFGHPGSPYLELFRLADHLRVEHVQRQHEAW